MMWTQQLRPDVRGLGDRLIDRMLAADPFTASQLGVSGYDAKAPDPSRSGQDSYRQELEAIRSAAANLITARSPENELLRVAIDNAAAGQLLDLANDDVEHTVSALPFSGPAAFWRLAATTVIIDSGGARDYLDRLRAAAGWIDAIGDRLRDGASRGRTPVASLADHAVRWADTVLAEPAPSALLAPAPPDGWDGAPAWRQQVDELARSVVAPALHRWREQIKNELLPVARPDDRAGVGWLPGGPDDYLRSIERHTTLPLTAGELHDIGVTRIAELEDRARELGAQIGLRSLPDIRRASRAAGSAPGYEAIELARVAVRKAESQASQWFQPPLPAPCAVEPMPPSVALVGTAPHYTPPRLDGGRPGTYWFNTLTGTVGTGWDCEAVAYHETVPGHHLQLARQQDQPDLPALLTKSVITVHAEGWGLYCERLAGEMGLFSDVRQQIGGVFMELHRAARLVVDTGIHALGWTRPRAIEFLAEKVPVHKNFLRAEVDRYISWPGQALAYLVGQREILGLREKARSALGERFDLPGFHSAVLDHGFLAMPALQVVVQQWIDSQGHA